MTLHTWIVTKAEGVGRYNRYDKVGWGSPVRTNAYAPDARWYSNEPQILKKIRGPVAESLIPKIEKAIADYPFANRGGYRIWPGPNSNSFVAHVLREVPELGVILPSNAVGRDYIAGNRWFHKSAAGGDFELSLSGYAGIAAGYQRGLELNFLGLVTGIDIAHPAIKLPGFGRLEVSGAIAGEAKPIN